MNKCHFNGQGLAVVAAKAAYYNVNDYIQKQYKMKRIFYIDEVKNMVSKLNNNQITIGKFVELLNDKVDEPKKTTVFKREECCFAYCPHPKLCDKKCLNE